MLAILTKRLHRYLCTLRLSLLHKNLHLTIVLGSKNYFKLNITDEDRGNVVCWWPVDQQNHVETKTEKTSVRL